MGDVRILVVSSSETTRHVVATILSREGYEVLTATDVSEAQRLLTAGCVALMLIEQRLSGSTGATFLKQLRQACGLGELPVIVVTQSDRDDEFEQALAAGADDYLTLPFSPCVVKARVNAALRVARAQDEMRLARQRYRVAARAADCGLWEWDIVHDRFYLTQPLQQLLALKGPLPATLSEFLELAHVDDRERLREAIRAHAGGYTGLLECELRMPAATSPARWYLCRGQVFRADSGWAERMVGAFVDVSERKFMETSLRDSLRELAEAKATLELKARQIVEQNDLLHTVRVELERKTIELEFQNLQLQLAGEARS